MSVARRLHPAFEMLDEALWARPAIAMAAGLSLGLGLAGVDGPDTIPLLDVADAGVAREVLLSLVTVTLTVTATVFGFIIVALQLTSSQFSPRSLRTFVRDRGTQWALAIFMGVVAYGIGVLLRTGDGEGEASAVALTLALLLTLVVVGTLAFLIHHTAQSIRIEHLMRSITDDTLAAIAAATAHDRHDELPAVPPGARDLGSPSSGYLQEVDLDGLAGLAGRCGVDLVVDKLTGEHCIEGLPLARVWGRDGAAVDDATLAALRRGLTQDVSIGLERTLVQDFAFGPRQLVDIALRAISPAINDPRTAVEATANLTRVLCALATHPLGPVVRHGRGGSAAGQDRLTFDEHLALACNQIRRYGGGDPTVCAALLVLLEQLGCCELSEERRAAVRRHVELVTGTARERIAQAADLEGLLRHADAVRALLDGEGHDRDASRSSVAER